MLQWKRILLEKNIVAHVRKDGLPLDGDASRFSMTLKCGLMPRSSVWTLMGTWLLYTAIGSTHLYRTWLYPKLTAHCRPGLEAMMLLRCAIIFVDHAFCATGHLQLHLD